jgi:hypothetical protein
VAIRLIRGDPRCHRTTSVSPKNVVRGYRESCESRELSRALARTHIKHFLSVSIPIVLSCLLFA